MRKLDVEKRSSYVFRDSVSGGSKISQMGVSTQEIGAPNYYLANFLPITAWKWKQLDRKGRPPQNPAADLVFPRRAHQSERGGGGAPTYYSAKMSWTLHENEENWTEKGRALGRGTQNFSI